MAPVSKPAPAKINSPILFFAGFDFDRIQDFDNLFQNETAARIFTKPPKQTKWGAANSAELIRVLTEK